MYGRFFGQLIDQGIPEQLTKSIHLSYYRARPAEAGLFEGFSQRLFTNQNKRISIFWTTNINDIIIYQLNMSHMICLCDYIHLTSVELNIFFTTEIFRALNSVVCIVTL